jgi:hypothetical protein
MWRTLLVASAVASVVVLPTSVAPATTTTSVAPATPTALADCPVGALCGWSENNFTGLMTRFGGWACLNSSIPLRSVANNTSGFIPKSLIVYPGKNCSGKSLGGVRPGESLPSLPGVGVSVYSLW